MNSSTTHNLAFELRRKSIHLLSLFVPFVALYSLILTQVIIIIFAVFYALAEWMKIKGKPMIGHPFISKMQRDDEKQRFAPAPLFLAMGTLTAISFFSWEAALIGIGQAGLSDTLAAIGGKKWGVTKLPLFRHKTVAGSCIFFLASLPPTFYFLPGSKATVLCMVGAFVESLPFKDWDNLLVPIVVTFLAEQFMF